MTSITIRININLPNYDDATISDTIERIIEFTRAQFPDLTSDLQSPITGTINQRAGGE